MSAMAQMQRDHHEAETRLRRVDAARAVADRKRQAAAEVATITDLVATLALGGSPGALGEAAAQLARLTQWRTSARDALAAATVDSRSGGARSGGVEVLLRVVADVRGSGEDAVYQSLLTLEQMLRRAPTRVAVGEAGIEAMMAASGAASPSTRCAVAGTAAIWAASHDASNEEVLLRRRWHLVLVGRAMAVAPIAGLRRLLPILPREGSEGKAENTDHHTGDADAEYLVPVVPICGALWSMANRLERWGGMLPHQQEAGPGQQQRFGQHKQQQPPPQQTAAVAAAAARDFVEWVVVLVRASDALKNRRRNQRLFLPALGLLHCIAANPAWRPLLLSINADSRDSLSDELRQLLEKCAAGGAGGDERRAAAAKGMLSRVPPSTAGTLGGEGKARERALKPEQAAHLAMYILGHCGGNVGSGEDGSRAAGRRAIARE